MKQTQIPKYNERNFETQLSRDETDIIHFYDKYAHHWDQRFDDTKATHLFMQKRLHSFMSILKDIPQGGIGIELGVGTGIYLKQIAPSFQKVYAVDGSSQMLEVLSQRIKIEKLENVFPIQSNVLHISTLEDHSADVIYFFGLLEHIVHIELFLSEISRLLKKNGKVIVVTPNGSSPWYSIRKIFRSTGKHCSTDHYYTLKELKKIFSQHCFSIQKSYFWGAIPAGIKNKPFILLLQVIEYVFERIPLLSRFLGGITACFSK